jgi:hypothetical protein
MMFNRPGFLTMPGIATVAIVLILITSIYLIAAR